MLEYKIVCDYGVLITRLGSGQKGLGLTPNVKLHETYIPTCSLIMYLNSLLLTLDKGSC
jgi:hypothetical protein